MTGSFISYDRMNTRPKFDDDTEYPLMKYFKGGATYNAETHEFKGTIDWSPKTIDGASIYEYSIMFSQDFTHIYSGHIIMKDAEGVEKKR